MVELPPPLPLTKRTFKVEREEFPYNLDASDQIFEEMTKRCSEGWEPIGMVLLPGEGPGYKVAVFFKR